MNGFRRVSFLGVGMMGATLARATRRAQPQAAISGYDVRRSVCGSSSGIDRWAGSVSEACRDADLVVLATPVSSILELLPEVYKACGSKTLVTDTGSTKAAVCAMARKNFTEAAGPHFIGGHPMAGREKEGAEASDPDMLRGAPYALCADSSVPDEKRQHLEAWVGDVGARPLWIDPEAHDRIAARVSHLPQLVVVALASLLDEAAAVDRQLPDLAGSALRDLLRIASSPYPLWDDILRTNSAALQTALEDLAERLRALSGDLERGKDIERLFKSARHFRENKLRVRP